MQTNRIPLYSEESGLAVFFKVFIGLMTAGLIFIAFFAVPKGNEAFIPLFAAAVLIIIIMSFFNKLKVTLYSDYLEVGFSFIRKKYLYSDIVSAEKTKIKIFNNIGMHTNLMGGWSFVTKYGPAVKIRLVKGGSCVFTSENPEMLLSVLEPMIGKK